MTAGLLAARADLHAEIADLEQRVMDLIRDPASSVDLAAAVASAQAHCGLYAQMVDVAGALAECCQMLGSPADADAARQQAEAALACWSPYAGFTSAAGGGGA